MTYTQKLQSLRFKEDILQNFCTGTLLDSLLSNEGGIPKGSNYMIVGDPGIGKTTLVMDMLVNIRRVKPELKVLFISAEMNDVDLYFLVQRFPKFSELETLFINCDDKDHKNLKKLEETLSLGWDAVAVDSFLELLEMIKNEEDWTAKKTESVLLDLFQTHNSGRNSAQKYTSFLTIQQVTKSGVFAGSNRLRHSITAMMELRLEDRRNYLSDRYICFTKHRRGAVGVRLYYDLTEGGEVFFNLERFEEDQKISEIQRNLQDEIKLHRRQFNAITESAQ